MTELALPTPADYRAFLESKVRLAGYAGFDVSPDELHPVLKPHQRAIVAWALRGGRRAIFAKFGLGKSVMQDEILHQVTRRAGGSSLIVAPYGAGWSIEQDVQERLGRTRRFINRSWEAYEPGAYWTNYESVREGHVDPRLFTATSLDEAAVLRDYGSETYQTFLPLFDAVKWKFVATAVPSPNRKKELIHYAGYLGVMDTGQALTRFFMRNPSKAGDLTLLPHKEEEFWLWVASWAVMIQRPSDLGFSDEGYEEPRLDVRWHEVSVDHREAKVGLDGQGALFRDSSMGVVDSAHERRATMMARIAKLTEIVAADPAPNRVIWHDLEDERLLIEQSIPGTVSVYGSQDVAVRAERTRLFSDGYIHDLAAKPSMLGAGTNLQRHCWQEVFVGVSPKFHDFIQALHRILRFGQPSPVVRVDIIFAESERSQAETLKRKWAEYEEMLKRMTQIIRKYGLDQLRMGEELKRSIGVERVEASGFGMMGGADPDAPLWRYVHNDTVLECMGMASDSVDLLVTSIPFEDQYEYTESYEDFGHCSGSNEFWRQMDLLIPHLLRVTKPGRIAAIHVKDKALDGGRTGLGCYTVDPVHERCSAAFRKHGWLYCGMTVITTDVVTENNQAYRLTFGEMLRDSSKMGHGTQEFMLVFRKPQSDLGRAYADEPVTHRRPDYVDEAGRPAPYDRDAAAAGKIRIVPGTGYSLARWQLDAHGHWRSSGNRYLTPDEIASLAPDVAGRAFREWCDREVYDFETHLKIGELLEVRGKLPKKYMALAPTSTSPDVWTDVIRMRTLNADLSQKAREKHVCPLQFDIVDRIIELRSNPGDLVFDPFGGVGTVPVRAMKLGRRGLGVELSDKYWHDAVGFCGATAAGVNVPGLFDVIDAEVALADEVAA